MAALCDGNAERLERRHNLVHATGGISTLAARRCPPFSRFSSHLVARHVAQFCSGDSDVPVLVCSFVGPAQGDLSKPPMAGHCVADRRTCFDCVILGAYTSGHGDTRGHVYAEIPTAHEHSLVARRAICGLCGALRLDARSVHTSRSAGWALFKTMSRNAGKKAVIQRAPEAPPVGRNRSGRALEAIRAAYSLIAEKGFEGLRTRDVAERVGINSATLHYYFPTKEALIQAVVEYLMEELKTSRAALSESDSALDRLRAEFSDIRARLKESPEQLVVLTELAVRAWRDETVDRLLRYLDQGWRGHLTSILRQGIKQKEFRADLDVPATANLLMLQLRGLGYQGKLDRVSLDLLVAQLALQTERWVLKLPVSRRGGFKASREQVT